MRNTGLGPTMSGEIEARLQSLGYSLPPASSPLANYVPFLIAGDLLFVSGQISRGAGGQVMTGCLGADLGVAAGQAAARACALNILAQAQAALGNLDRIRRLVRMTGFVSAVPTFMDHPKVLNGASDLMIEVLGDKGRHTRTAVGAASLPAGSAVEIDAILQID